MQRGEARSAAGRHSFAGHDKVWRFYISENRAMLAELMEILRWIIIALSILLPFIPGFPR